MSTTIPTSHHGASQAAAVWRQPLAVRLLLVAGLVGPLLFFIVVLVEGATRPGYNALHHTVSTLALGPQGWVLTTALLVLGALLLCFAAGLRRVLNLGRGSTWGPILVAVCGLAFIGEAIFPTDPILGYPPGAAATLTLHGSLHHLLSIVFEAPPIVAACIVLARRFAQAPGGRPWVLYSIATIILVVVFDVLGVLAGLSNDPGSLFGLFQRLEFFTAVGWIALLAGRLLTGPAFEA
jgi:hypothetical membrane protein